jgi:hypothetical protein
VGYALARSFAPTASATCAGDGECLVVVDAATGAERRARHFAVRVGFTPALVDSCGPCADGACGRVTLANGSPRDVLLASP